MSTEYLYTTEPTAAEVEAAVVAAGGRVKTDEAGRSVIELGGSCFPCYAQGFTRYGANNESALLAALDEAGIGYLSEHDECFDEVAGFDEAEG
jgi:hypothetical protein